jgi:integrase
MAAIEKRINAKKEVSYRVKVRMLGYAPETATFTSLTRAKKWAQDTESAMRDGRHFITAEAKKHTMGDAIDKYLAEVLPLKPKNAPATKAQLLWWKEQIGIKVLSAVSSTLVDEKKTKLTTEPIKFTRKETQADGTKVEIVTERQRSPATVNRYLAALSQVFTEVCGVWKWMPREQNPMAGMKKHKESSGRVRYLKDDERESLLLACKASGNSFLFPIVAIAISTGARYGEIMGLTWDDVDFLQRRIILRDTKNGDTRAVPLAGLAFDELKTLSKVKRIDTKLIFASKVVKVGKPIKPILVRKAWETALKKAGIENFKFHDLRHTAASYLAMNGASLAEIAEVLGHKTLQMVKRYAHLSEQHTLGVVERMNRKIFG